jgi:predicted PurR-regulated permease PerM/CheY-like chemotaxis protein
MDKDRTPAWSQVLGVLRVLFTVLAVLAGLWLLYALVGVLALVVLAVFFAYVLSPLVLLVQRVPPLHGRRHARVTAILITYLTLFGSVSLAVYAVAPRFGAQLSELGHSLPVYVEWARGGLQSFTRTYRSYRLPEGIRNAIESGAEGAVQMAGQTVRDTVTMVIAYLQFLPWLILIPVLAFFFLKDADTFRSFALRLLPEGRLRWRGRDYLNEIHTTLALYVRAQLIASVLIGVTCWVGLALIGVPYALVLGVVAALLEFIPMIGPLIVAVLAAFFASTQSATHVGATIVFLGVLRLVQDYVILPRLVATGMKLHPLAIILTLVCGSHLAGVAGMFLALPAAAVLMVTHRYILLQLGQANLLAALVPREVPEPSEVLIIDKPSRLSTALIEGELSGITVTVVDNDDDTRIALVDLLEHSGALVFPAASAAEALIAIEEKRPHVLISDLAMPEQDGFDLIRAVRLLPAERGGSIGAAALSGYSTEEDRSRSLAAGFQEHLPKPVDPSALIATVRRLAQLATPLPAVVAVTSISHA